MYKTIETLEKNESLLLIKSPCDERGRRDDGLNRDV